MASPLPNERLQPVVNDHAEDGRLKESTVCVRGKRVKVTTIISVVTVLLAISISGVSFVRTWGLNEGRIIALEGKATTAHVVQEQVRSRLNSVDTRQAATQSTVEAIKKTQSEDRRHLDTRLDRLYEAITRSR